MENHVSTCEGNYESVQVTQNYRCGPETASHLGGRASQLIVQKQTRQVCSSMKHLQLPQSCKLWISSTRRNWEPLLLITLTLYSVCEKICGESDQQCTCLPFLYLSVNFWSNKKWLPFHFINFSAVYLFSERQNGVKRKET